MDAFSVTVATAVWAWLATFQENFKKNALEIIAHMKHLCVLVNQPAEVLTIYL